MKKGEKLRETKRNGAFTTVIACNRLKRAFLGVYIPSG